MICRRPCSFPIPGSPTLLTWPHSSHITTDRYVDARTISGFSPLHYCCIADVATVRALLAHEPRLIISNKWGSWEYPLESFSFTTPLHVAVIKGNLPVAMEILRHYVSPPPLFDAGSAGSSWGRGGGRGRGRGKQPDPT